MKGYGDETTNQAGAKAVSAKTGNGTEKQKQVISLRIPSSEKQNLDDLATKIKDHGYGYSASNTLRIALRLLNDVDDITLLKVCEDLKNEDLRRK